MLKNVICKKTLHTIRSLVDYLLDPNDNLKTIQNRIVTMFDKVPSDFLLPD